MIDKVINFGLLKNPLNWLTVVLMVLIAGIFFDIVFTKFSDKE